MMRIESLPNLNITAAYGDRRAASRTQLSGEGERVAPAMVRSETVQDADHGLGATFTESDGVVTTTPFPRVEPVDEFRGPFPGDDSSETEDAEFKLEGYKGDLEELVNKLNEINSIFDNSLEFRMDPDTDTTIMRVVSKESGEILREIPSGEVLSIMDRVFSALGVVLDQTA